MTRLLQDSDPPTTPTPLWFFDKKPWRNHEESHSTPVAGSSAPKEKKKQMHLDPSHQLVTATAPCGVVSVQQLLPLTAPAAAAPQMDVFAVPADRQRGWYLSLMAPNTKGPQFAWLDPSRLYCNSQVRDRRTRLLFVQSAVCVCLFSLSGSGPGSGRLCEGPPGSVSERYRGPGRWDRCDGLHTGWENKAACHQRAKVTADLLFILIYRGCTQKHEPSGWDTKFRFYSLTRLGRVFNVSMNVFSCLSGASVANTLGKGFLAIRKAGHLCVATQNQNYSDYSGREKVMEVRTDVLKPGYSLSFWPTFVSNDWTDGGDYSLRDDD